MINSYTSLCRCHIVLKYELSYTAKNTSFKDVLSEDAKSQLGRKKYQTRTYLDTFQVNDHKAQICNYLNTYTQK